MHETKRADAGVSRAVWAAAVVLLGGAILQAGNVSAGNGRVIDWREVKSGETLMDDGDAFDVAYLFVALVGEEIALATIEEPGEPPAEPRERAHVVTWTMDAPGRRARSIYVGGFEVVVKARLDENNELHEGFTSRLAEAAEQIVAGGQS